MGVVSPQESQSHFQSKYLIDLYASLTYLDTMFYLHCEPGQAN